MKRLPTIALFAAALGLLVSPLAQARGPHGRHAKGMRMMRALELSNEQRTEIERLRLEMQQDTLELRAQLRDKREQMKALWMKEQPDEKAILAKAREMDPLRQKLRTRRIKLRLAVHQILTPEQRDKMREMMERRGRGMGPMGPGMMGPGPMGAGMMGPGPMPPMGPGGPDGDLF